MKKSKLSILLLFLVMILAISAVSAADDTNDTSDSVIQTSDVDAIDEIATADVDDVVQASDDNAEVLTDVGDKNFTALQDEINSANGLLEINSNYVRAEGEKDIEITQNILLLGDDTHKIDANLLGGIFKINSGITLTLNNVILVNGNNDNGGAIYNEGTVNIISSELTDNSAKIGGAIYNKGIASISGSTLNGNQATTKGGAVYSEGTLVVSDSSFENNKISTGDSYTDSLVDCNGGGAIYASNDIRVTRSTFTKNTAPHASEVFSAGGAIYIKETTALIDDCTFNENSAVYGGAIIFEDFSQDTVAIKDSRFNNNQAWQGGAINGNDLVGSLIITGSNFTTNKATTPNAGQSSPTGGAIMVGSKSYAGIALDVAGCNFVENDGGYMGGAIASSPDNTIKVADSNFTGNFATTLGGAIVTGTGTELTVSGSTFNDNKVSGTGMGGAIFCEPTSKNNITGSNFTNNVDRYPSAIMSYQGTLDLSENTFTGTSIFNYAGTITSEIKAIVLNNDTVETDDGNVALSARVTDDNDNVIRDSTLQFDINGVKVAAVYDVADGYYKATYALPAPGFFTVGIISSKNDDMTVKNGTVKNFKGTFKDLQNIINAATGTLDLAYDFAFTPELGDTATEGIVIDKDLTINGNGYTISGNNAARIFVIDVFATVNLEDIVFANGAADYGGAIYAAGILNVDNCTFINNTAAVAGNAIYVPEEYTVYIIDSEESYNALLNDPASALNKYYIANPREDGIDADGNPVYDETTEIVGHSWLSAITADAVNVPDGKTKFPWILLNMNKFNGVVNIDFNGTHVFGPWNLAGRDKMFAIISVPASDDCNMVEYALEKGTGNADKKLDASLFVVKLDSDEFTTETAMDNTVSIKDSKFFDNGDDTDYAIYNLGKLALENNTISNLIYNEGELVNSIINITVMDNEEHNFSFHGVTLYAVVTDDNGNLITDSGFKFLVNTTEVTATYNPDTKLYEATYTPSDVGKYVVSMTHDGTATLIVKTANITFTKSLIDIQNMIDAAEAGDAIELTGDYAYVEEFDKGIVNGIVIDKAITIDGKGYTISGSDAARIFNVGNNAVLTLSNVTLTKGKAVNGGAVYVEAGATLNTDYVAFNENTATYRGGAIWSAGTANIDHSSFDNNNITYRAKNADNGGAAIFSKGNLNVDHSVFTNDLVGYVVRTGDHNNPQLIDGAVLSAGVAVINNSYFENNSGTYGAAITAVPIKSVGSTSTSLIVENSEFVNNLAYNGAAINVNADGNGKATYSINNCTFIGNNATGIGSTNTGCDGGAIFLARDTEGNITNSRFYNNTAGRGGAIAISASKNSLKATIDNCEFINNTAVGTIENKAIGGAIRIGGSASADNMIVSVENSNFTNNVAADGGASIYNEGTLSLSGNNVTSGNAEIEVGAKGFITSTIKVTILDGEVKTIDTLEAKLSAKVTDDKDNLIKDAQFKFTINDEEVAAVYNVSSKLYEATYTLPSAGIYPVNITYASDDELEVENGTVKSIYGTFTYLQKLAGLGPFIEIVRNYTYVEEIDGEALKDGVVFGDYAYYNINGNGYTISGNDVARIFNIRATVLINNITFANGNAVDGGAVYIGSVSSGFVGFNPTYVNFINNTATRYGGAIYSEVAIDPVNCLFEDNAAGIYGGAIYIDGGFASSVSNSVFENNTAMQGGAIFHQKTGLIVKNSTFNDNKAIGTANGEWASGAAILSYLTEYVTIKDSNFTANNAQYNGGAIYFYNSNVDANVEIDNCRFEENVAGDSYGTIYVTNHGNCEVNFNINNSKFINNTNKATTADYGSAALLFMGNNLTIANSEFTDNKGTKYSAVYYYASSTGTLTINNTNFTNNDASVGNAVVDIVNGNAVISNAIFDSNTAAGKGEAVYVRAAATASISDSTFKNNGESTDYAIYNLGTLTLSKNNISNYIYSTGTISSSVNATFLGNAANNTIDAALYEEVHPYATLTDDNGNVIYDPTFKITVDGVELNTTYDEANKVYTANYTIPTAGDKVVSTNYDAVKTEGKYVVPKANVTEFTVTVIDTLEGKNATVFVTLIGVNENLTATVTVIVNNKEETVEVINGTGNKTISGLTHGSYPVVAMFNGSSNYNSEINSTVFNVKGQSVLNITELTVAEYGDVIEITINLTDTEGNPISGIVVIDNVNKVIVYEDGIGTFTIDNQPDVGNYTFQAVYDGNDDYFGDLAIFNVTVTTKAIDPEDIVVDIQNINEFGDEIPITITSPVDGTYNVTINGTTVQVEVINGTGNANVTLDNPGIYNATVNIDEEEYTLETITTDDFEYLVTPKFNVVITGTYPNAEITITGPAGTYHVLIDGQEEINITREESGLPTVYTIEGIDAGDYTAFVSFDAHDEYYGDVQEVNFTVAKAASSVTIDPITNVVYGNPVVITFNIVNETGVGEILITDENGKSYDCEINGSTVTAILPAGEYTISIHNGEDANYNESEETATFTVYKAEALNITYDGGLAVMGGGTVNITVASDATGYVIIDNNGVTLYGELENGKFTFDIHDLTAGDYKITVTYYGDDNYNKTEAIKVLTIPKAVVVPEITDVTTPILEGQDAVITVTMDNNLATGNVTVFVDDGEYDVFVLDDASAIIKIIGLTKGNHTIIVQYNGDDNYKSDKNATVDITVYGNVVTNETFFSYFDEYGVLRDNVPFDELIFSGEFSDLGITHVIVDNIVITGDDAKLTNIGFVANGNVALSNMTLIADTSLGRLIYVAEDDVVITGMDISYTVGDEDAVAIDVTGVNNVIIVDNKITFTSQVAKDTTDKSAMAINIDESSNVIIEGNDINTTLIGVDANYGNGGLYDRYGMMGVGNVNPVRILGSSDITFNSNTVNSKLSDIKGYWPTIQSVLVVASKDLEFEGNNFKMIDDVTAAGTPSYLYSFTFGMNDGVDLYYNNFFMSTEGGATATGTAYALQIVSSNMTIIGNNITSISNGPNLGIYAVCDYNTFDDFELYIADNIINVTGKVTSTTTWNDLLSGIEIGHGDVEIEGNTINVYNKAGYIEGSYVYGISYAQRVYAPTFSISDNTVIVPDATYAIGIYHIDDVTATENYLIAHDLYGDQAVYVNGSEAVIEENYPQDLNITITVENCTVSDPVEISVTTNPLFNGQITVTIGTNDYIINIIDGEGGDMLDSVPANTYNVVASYAGDTYFKADEDNATLVVSRLVSNITITTGDVVVDAPLVVNVTMEYVDGNVTVIVDGNEFTLALDTGLGTFTIPKENMTAGNHSITVIFAGDDTYDPADATYNFTVEKAEDYEFDVNLTIDEIDIGENVTINVTLPEDANGNITVTVDGKPVTFKEVVNGTATVTVPAGAFTAGRNNTIAVTYSDDKYGETTVTKEIPVNKLPYAINATADNIELGQNATIIINVPTGADGKATVELQGNFYPAVDGKVILEGLGEGTYTANVYFFDDSVYEDNHTTVTFNVTKVEITPEQAFNFTTPENSTSEVISVNLPEDATGFLLLDINGTQTHVPLVNGTANVTVPNLEEGTYNATITYTGDDKYAPISTTKEINVTSNVPENALNIPAGSKSDEPTTYSISLPSDAGGFLMVDVDGTKYAAPLNNGSASVTVPALSPGSHNVTVTYTGDDKYSPVTKATTLNVTAPVFKITNNKNVAAVYSAKATYKVLVTRDGKAVGAGETVTFKYNGKTYTVKTDSKGYATFKPSTKVKVKKYTVTAEYKGVKVSNKVTIKHVIKAKNKKVKKSKKVNKVVITLKKVNKKYLKKKTIKVKFKGKTYKVKTNKKGKATWKVKKSVLKKLKVGKKYKYKVTYGKDKVTKKLTIKK